MKAKFLPFIFTGLASFTFAQYSTPNTGVEWTLDDIAAASPETVTVSGNEYKLHENLIIETNDALLLNENLTLKIGSEVEIEVKGKFISDAGDEQITITAIDNETPYEGFWFYDESEGFFRNTLITHGGGIRVVTAKFEMYNCEMTHNIKSDGSSSGGAISFSKGSPVIKNSIFKFNVHPALSSGANTSVSALIEGNYFEGNNTSNNNRPQINMGPSGDADSIRIINNTVIGDRDLTMVGGISASSLVNVLNKIVIKGNIVKNNRYGITSMGNSTGVIADNVIEDNNSEGIPMNGGSGINLFSTNLIYVKNNQIRRNLWGVTMQGTAQANFGSDDDEDFNPGGNVFSENGNEGEVYALFNNTPNTVKALHNCWIEGQESTIEDVENVISHKNDDDTLGEVFFDPFECGVLMSINDLNKNSFKIYPNPARNSFFIESQEKGNVTVYDLSGKKVLSKNNLNGQNQINISLPKGIYLVEFDNQKSKTTKKLVVE
ncbi:T9SS type A sorting domain-containing protein [Moheibacter sediminis]|uniref:Por secretion system C-terminal sorting domain-containing protein n=1 Tax=Moheibacter sediminis TaxID=1434700 RepID=A0A1W2AE61_9FLAO|nr:T9SS type A sorting domain-containing protein [Moheibacter sediminis]SMC58967.1 Por secretion system C-terminal sorting domain-containing protein [Moheibacter sediminis]